MKKVYLLSMLMLLSAHLYCQTNWVKHSGNPVMTAGPEEWEDVKLAPGSVIFYDGKYHMWYSGGDFPALGGDFLIGHATSSDGITWMKDTNNPVFGKDSAGAWDDKGVFDPSVLLVDSVFHMWYNGYSDDNTMHSIGHATSPDGITWTRDENNPVVEEGASGAWDETSVQLPTVVYDGSEYHMYFAGQGNSVPGVFIGHATSPDGSVWSRDPQNPVLSPGNIGSWDYDELTYPSAVFDGSTYHIWFAGGQFLHWDVGYATSPDGIVWTKHDEPVLTKGSGGTFESEVATISIPSVMIDSSMFPDTMFKIWYRGQRADGTGGIGYAESSPSTAVLDNKTADLIRIYPIPASEMINIHTGESGSYSVKIHSLNGQMLYHKNFEGNNHQIYLSSFQKGVYLITVRSRDYVLTRKLIKL